MYRVRIALLYICTGEYVVFWEEFFKSFESFFLPDFEKEYFVFSDVDVIAGQETGRVHLRHIEWQPWPIPTLMKFHTFLLVEEQLRCFDYVYQPNSNSRCRRKVTAEEFLPRREKGETLFFTEHPAKWFIEDYQYPYYRNRQSMAYVPYNRETVGVFGAMNGGETNAFIGFMKEMAERTEHDLKKCIIPAHHDESYINNYLVRHADDACIRFLPSDFGYPQEYDIPCERIIELEDKSRVLNVEDLKYIRTEARKRTFVDKIKGRIHIFGEKAKIKCKQIRDGAVGREAN